MSSSSSATDVAAAARALRAATHPDEVDDDSTQPEPDDDRGTAKKARKRRRSTAKGTALDSKDGDLGGDNGLEPRVLRGRAQWDRERLLLEKEMAILQVRLEQAQARVADRDREVAKLEKLLQDERAESKRFYQTVDTRTNSLVDGMTHVMAKSHQTAMQTLQSSQQMNAQMVQSALGQSITRLRDAGTNMRMLMPPTTVVEDLSKTGPEGKRQFHEKVAKWLTSNVPNVERGRALQLKLEQAINAAEKVVAEERAKLKDGSSQRDGAELSQLAASIEEQERQVDALRFERNMLVAGLADFERRAKQSNPMGQQSNPMGQQTNPMGQQTNPVQQPNI